MVLSLSFTVYAVIFLALAVYLFVTRKKKPWLGGVLIMAAYVGFVYLITRDYSSGTWASTFYWYTVLFTGIGAGFYAYLFRKKAKKGKGVVALTLLLGLSVMCSLYATRFTLDHTDGRSLVSWVNK